MKFKDALKQIYQEWKASGLDEDPVVFGGRIADLTPDDATAEDKINLLIRIGKVVKPATVFKNKGAEDGYRELVALYPEVSSIVSERLYGNLMILFADAEEPGFIANHPLVEKDNSKTFVNKANNGAQQPQKPAKKPAAAKKQQKAVAKQQPKAAPANKPKNPPVATGANTGNVVAPSQYSTTLGGVFGWITFFAVFWTVMWLIFRNFSWSLWQWFVGFGGVITVFIMGYAVLDYIGCFIKKRETYYTVVYILLLLLTITNFVLKLIFKADYNVVYPCFSIMTFITMFFELVNFWKVRVGKVICFVLMMLFLLGTTVWHFVTL